MDKTEFAKIVADVEKENLLFINKVHLEALTSPSTITGRESQIREIVSLLATHKQGFVVPFISIYGRSGSGKSTVVKFVCENLEILHCFVNLRKARTVFGCANLILSELGELNLKSAQGINLEVEKIHDAILSILKKTSNKLFVLVLDEFDVLFYDKRGRPSDFIYKLLVMEEKLREQGYLISIIAISNNMMSEYEIDDRIRSRIGSSEVFFNAYKKQDLLAILNHRVAIAFSMPIDPGVLEYCAEISSAEHGDARRANDLLRVAAGIASSKSEPMDKKHFDVAAEQLRKDRVKIVLSTASKHLRLVIGAIAINSHALGEVWNSTSLVYETYCRLVGEGNQPLTYRRVSGLLVELENTGLTVSQTSSKGRSGYGTRYKLTVSPEIVGRILSEKWWDREVSNHIAADKIVQKMKRSEIRSKRSRV